MEVSTKRCFIERSVQFEEYQLHDTPLETHEGITIYPPIFYDDDVLQVSNSDEEDHIQHDPVIETESQEILIQIQYPFLIRSLNPDGLKIFLM